MRDWGFPYMVYGAPAPGPDVRVAFVPVPEEQIRKLAGDLGKKLVEPLPDVPPEMLAKMGAHDVLRAPPVFAQIGVPGHDPLHAKIDRFGQTAAMAQWIHRMTVEVGTGRRGGQVQAVSVYLTGVDRDADNCALAACARLRFGTGNALPVEPGVWEKLRNESRPLAVQIFAKSLARVDPSVLCSFLALGAAFFGTLGVEGEENNP